MISSEGECVSFQQKIIPKEFKSSVEKWLNRLEKLMKNSLEKLVEDSYIDILTHNNNNKKQGDNEHKDSKEYF